MSPRDMRRERLPDGGMDGMDGFAPSRPVAQVGLWLFMGVVTALFSLFSLAYLMRMAGGDWRPLPAVPWQLWLSTALLAAGSGALALAHREAARGRRRLMTREFIAGSAAALAFVGVQLWAWQQMLAWSLPVGGNPANSFFYLITGLHGLHVLGGLVAAAVVGVQLGRGASLGRARMAIGLCAQYWHFLLALWLVVFGLLFFVTPELVQAICNRF